MARNLELSRGVIFSERVLLALVEHGMDRKAAYELVQRHAMRAWDEGADFRDLVRTDPEISTRVDAADFDDLFDYGYYLRHVAHTFARLGFNVPAAGGEKPATEGQAPR